MNLQLIFSEREMEEFLKKLGYEIKTENEVDGVISNAHEESDFRYHTNAQKHKYAGKEGGAKGRLESVFWQELKKKLLSL
jgi:hypothetical protein